MIQNKHTAELAKKSAELEAKAVRQQILDIIKREQNPEIKQGYIDRLNQNKYPLTEKELKLLT
jgi:hypothetical protein